MTKYMREYDGEIFTEEEIWDVISECVEGEEIEDAMQDFDFWFIWNHLDETARDIIYEKAREIALDRYFTEIEEEDEDDE